MAISLNHITVHLSPSPRLEIPTFTPGYQRAKRRVSAESVENLTRFSFCKNQNCAELSHVQSYTADEPDVL